MGFYNIKKGVLVRGVQLRVPVGDVGADGCDGWMASLLKNDLDKKVVEERAMHQNFVTNSLNISLT